MRVARLVSALAFVALASASTGDNTIEDDRVVQVAPVLAPPRDSGIHDTTRSRQFPILVLLALRNSPENTREHEAKSLGDRPVYYVQKLEDQPTPESGNSRQKRSFKKHHGGYGGHGGHGSTVIIVPVHHGGGGGHRGHRGGGGYHGHGGGYGGGCRGGCGQSYYPSGGHSYSSSGSQSSSWSNSGSYGGGYGK